MRTDLFDFDLPADRIALRPARPRDAARLLVVDPNHSPELDDCAISDLPDLLRPGDAIVFNDTKVIPARLSGRRVRLWGHVRPHDSYWYLTAKPELLSAAALRFQHYAARGDAS